MFSSQELLIPLSQNQDDKALSNSIKKVETKVEMNSTFKSLLDACRKAEDSDDMNKLIDKKLIKYYMNVHPDFLNSKSFCKSVKAVTVDILKHPELVYYKL